MKKVCGNENFCRVLMFPKDNKIFNQYEKFDKTLSIINADLESLIKRTYGFKYNSKKSSTLKVGQYSPCGYSMSTIRTCDDTENKHYIYRGND